MQHPDCTSQLARERHARYRAEASRLARPAPSGDGRVVPTATTEADGD